MPCPRYSTSHCPQGTLSTLQPSPPYWYSSSHSLPISTVVNWFPPTLLHLSTLFANLSSPISTKCPAHFSWLLPISPSSSSAYQFPPSVRPPSFYPSSSLLQSSWPSCSRRHATCCGLCQCYRFETVKVGRCHTRLQNVPFQLPWYILYKTKIWVCIYI